MHGFISCPRRFRVSFLVLLLAATGAAHAKAKRDRTSFSPTASDAETSSPSPKGPIFVTDNVPRPWSRSGVLMRQALPL